MTVVAKDERLSIEQLELAPFGTNAYIIICRSTGESILVDAPGEADKILERLKDTTPKYMLITHSHMDHTGALRELKTELKIPVAIHPSDASGLPNPPDFLLENDDIIAFGKLEFKVVHTPGHTPGSVCLLSGQHLISGDTLFPGGPGRTNTPDALKTIITSLEEKIFILPDDVRVYPGHGTPTVLEKEREEFILFASRSHSPNLCGDVLWLSS